jgi:hypothetical protein
MLAIKIKGPAFLLLVLLSPGSSAQYSQEQKQSGTTTPEIPKTWDPTALASLEVPLAEPSASPVPVPFDFYYAMPIRPIYKSYPIYAPGHEPADYMNWLKQQEPEVIWGEDLKDKTMRTPPLKTESDWIKAGEIVFDSPIFYDLVATASQVSDPAWYKATAVPLGKNSTLPYVRYVIRQKGKIEVGNNACASCHIRVTLDGTIIKGGQGNFPFDRSIGFGIRASSAQSKDKQKFLEDLRHSVKELTGAPWLHPDPNGQVDHMLIDEIASAFESVPPGVAVRHGTSIFFPTQVPDLIGLKDRKYFDHTGLVRHRTVGDLMRYAALNNEIDFYSAFAGFIPAGADFRKLPDPKTLDRYGDDQLYALGLYIYSLKPPPNPNQFDQLAAQGEKVFEHAGCGMCHTPPLYTSNKLTPAAGFAVPPDHLTKYDILKVTVGTDPNLALKTRRGTGYYKVPSLKGAWYRGPFEHNGSVASLEDWFNPLRHRDDYVPTGFVGYGVRTRAVKGHPFGLNLSEDDRRALIAFLKTL